MPSFIYQLATATCHSCEHLSLIVHLEHSPGGPCLRDEADLRGVTRGLKSSATITILWITIISALYRHVTVVIHCIVLRVHCFMLRIVSFRVLELTLFFFIGEAGFNVAKKMDGTLLATVVNVPGQCGGNIITWTAITQQGVLHHHANVGLYKTGLLFTFVNKLRGILIPEEQRGGTELLWYHLVQREFPPVCSGPQLVHHVFFSTSHHIPNS